MRGLITLLAAFAAIACTCFRLAAQSYDVSTVVGGNFAGDGSPATSALLFNVEGLAFDGSGSLYIADATEHRVRRVSPGGIISTVAGNGLAGFSGDGGPAVDASLNLPYGLATDGKGNLYIADLGNGRVRCVSPDGVIRTVAAQPLKSPRNLAAHPDGGLFISDYDLHRVFRLTANGKLEAISLGVRFPAGLALSRDGTLYAADSGNRRVWRVAPDGRAAVVAGAFDSPIGSPTGLALDSRGNLVLLDADAGKVLRRNANGEFSTLLQAAGLRDIALDADGNLHAGGGIRVLRASGSGPPVTVAGGNAVGEVRDKDDALQTRLTTPIGIVADRSGSIWIAEQRARRLRRVNPKGQIETVLKDPALRDPVSVAVDSEGSVRVADFSANRIVGLSPSGVVSTIAGTGAAGYSGDGELASKAKLDRPRGMAFASDGSLYFADSGNHVIRRISISGVITTVAGNGKRGSEGDGGRAVSAQLNAPAGVAFDSRGVLYIADSGNNAIRTVGRDGIISTLRAGIEWNFPSSLAIDETGSVLVADAYGHRIVRLASGAAAQVIAGDGSPGFFGDGGPAARARFNVPVSLALDPAGGILVADLENQRVRKLSPRIQAPSAEPPSPSAPVIADLAVWSAATLRPTSVAPGQLLALPGRPPANPEVRFDGKAAAGVSVLADRIVVRAPLDVSGSVEIEVRSGAATVAWARVAVVDAAPAFFTQENGNGPVTAVHADGSFNSESNPAARGSAVTVFATGEGKLAPVRVEIGASEPEILWSGPAPGFPGVLQINIRLPGPFSPPGVRPITLYAGDAASAPGTTIALR